MNTLNVQNPYVGPKSFGKDDQDRFFGRTKASGELLATVFANRLTLLYAQSGTGKTSLLNASLIPDLESEKFEVLPIVRVKGGIPSEVVIKDISNIYIFSILLNWQKWVEKDIPIQDLGKMTLNQFLNLKEHNKDKVGEALPRAIIIDQFEELFTLYPERWKERANVFEQINEAVGENRFLRVIISMREDYIAYLDAYPDFILDRTVANYRLERLRDDEALEAVVKPLQSTNRHFDDEAAKIMIRELLSMRVQTASGETREIIGEFVEPVQLQVVCSNLWQHLPPNITTIRSEHIFQYGKVDDALSNFYKECLSRASSNSGIPISKIHAWMLKTFITSANTRSMVYRELEKTNGLPNSILDEFEQSHLIRGEWRLGSRWYELTHDRLIEPIRSIPMPSPKVYISFSIRDINAFKFAEVLNYELEKAGFSPLMPSELEDWSRERGVTIDLCDAFIAILSEGSYDSKLIQAEQSRAFRKSKTIIPIIVDLEIEIPFMFEPLNMIDATRLGYNRALFDVIKHLNKLIML